MDCPECQHHNPEGAKFCNECGYNLDEVLDATEASSVAKGKRKHATILFSDLSGYTAITENVDPEEVKRIMKLIFSKITKIIKSYEGFIEKFIGDAVMAVFGVPKAHEDDPIRAIRAAIEIHYAVEGLSPKFEDKIGHSLKMHSGINTGLVVTGDIGADGTEELTGDAVNLASRLEGIAKAGEIIVGPDTYAQTVNYFEYEKLKPTRIKGKQQLFDIYKVQSAQRESFKTHRLQGLQAALTGRYEEMKLLSEAVERLKQGQGSIVSIYGDAGTGKSRLKKELKDTLIMEDIAWHEGHAFGYTKNVPYYPLINLLTHAFQIDEGDSPEQIRLKVEAGIAFLLGEDNQYTPYIGSLFALTYLELEGISPEYWKDKLYDSIQAVLRSLKDKGPTIVCFEDLHWADPSFIELLHRLLKISSENALFICTYRSHFSLFDGAPPDGIRERHQEIHLRDLEPIDAQAMLNSLLKTESIPNNLSDFVRSKAEGNPFYLEEMINSLIESEILTRDNGNWKVNRGIIEADIPATIQGVLSARVDRLEKYSKRVLQEASVIGRAFLYDILKKITEIDTTIDQYLSGLESLDLIRTQSMEPELEYIFKHALTQEVVYNGLLKTERQEIHEHIGLAIEQLFQDRLPEFYEALSFHFGQSKSLYKAVDYLIKSGEKSLSKYAVQESHQYYEKAYRLITDKQTKTEKERELLFDLLIKWSLVYYYRGDFKGHTALLKRHENEADLVNDKEKRGMFYGWLGFILQFRWELADSYRYLQKALKLGEEAKNQRVIGYACTWLIYACAVMDKYEEGKSYWKRAVPIAKEIESDTYLYFKSMGGLGYLNAFSGEKKHSYEIGNQLLEYGMKHSNIRTQVVGHVCIGHSYFSEGNLTKAISCYRKAIDVAEDPFYTQWPRVFVGICCVLNDQLNEAEEALNEVSSYLQNFGCEVFAPAVMPFVGIVLIKKGDMSKGLKTIEKNLEYSREKNFGWGITVFEYVLGNLYYQIACGDKPSMSIALKNFGFLVKNVPFASKKAENYFNTAIESAKQFQAKGFEGMANLDLGLLHKAKKRNNLAEKYISQAIRIFKQIGAEVRLKKAHEELKLL